MADLRQILSQGRKRIGLLIGAGAPTAIRVDEHNSIVGNEGRPLVPDVARLTTTVINALCQDEQDVVEALKQDIGGNVNIEHILTQTRRLAQVIGSASIHGCDDEAYRHLGKRICDAIGEQVRAKLPSSPNPYTELVSWIAGTQRLHPVEIFTPNYDLLIEEAFERARIAYFDGFTGSHRPFFDPVSVLMNDLPPRWSRLWKLHGSLGWEVSGDAVVRTGDRSTTELIYPDHLKYDQVTRLPYSALFERLRTFLTTPDTLLICSGFSFLDSHICAVMDESLAANSHTAVLAFQYKRLAKESAAIALARSRPNISVYAKDGAVINGVHAPWRPSETPTNHDESVRNTFWGTEPPGTGNKFLLGDFAMLARFLALIQAQEMTVAELESAREGGAVTPNPTTQEPSDA